MPRGSLYRQARRRPAHLRTKTGCLTCRKRKKKCDETRTRCLNCTRQSLSCVWQFSVDQPLQPESEHHVHPLSNSSTEHITMPTDLTVQHRMERADAGRYHLPSLRHIHWSPSPAITPHSGPLFDFLRTTFLPQLIRPATDGTVTNGLNRETMQLALGHPFCMHALLACCGAEMPTKEKRFRQLARFHYTHAVAGLRRTLTDSHLECRWVVTMLTIMMLCIYERTKPNGSSGVEIHLAGAARLIALSSINSTTNDNSQISNAEGAMHRLARESFIFHVATSLPFQQSDAYRVEIETALSLAEQAISQHFRPNLLLHPDSPVLGFPPELFRCVYTVYRLYQSSSCQEVSLETRQTLDRDLQEWDQRIKARCRTPAKEEASPKSEVENEGFQIISVLSSTEREPNYWWMGPKLYTLGCRLLLRRMKGPDQAQLAPTVDQLLPEGVDALRKLQPDQDYYADYYCWPLFAIGMHLQSPPDRQLLLRQVWAFWEATNNGTMRRLADMLEFFWK